MYWRIGRVSQVSSDGRRHTLCWERSMQTRAMHTLLWNRKSFKTYTGLSLSPVFWELLFQRDKRYIVIFFNPCCFPFHSSGNNPVCVTSWRITMRVSGAVEFISMPLAFQSNPMKSFPMVPLAYKVSWKSASFFISYFLAALGLRSYFGSRSRSLKYFEPLYLKINNKY